MKMTGVGDRLGGVKRERQRVAKFVPKGIGDVWPCGWVYSEAYNRVVLTRL